MTVARHGLFAGHVNYVFRDIRYFLLMTCSMKFTAVW